MAMTEGEWLTSDDAPAMVLWFQENWNGPNDDLDRIIKRYCLACCRRIGKLLHHKDSRRGVKVLERFVDGIANYDDVYEAEWKAESAYFYIQHRMGLQNIAHWTKRIAEIPPDELSSMLRPTSAHEEWTHYDRLKAAAYFVDRSLGYHRAIPPGREKCANWTDGFSPCFWPFLPAWVLRDVVGNPFHPAMLDSRWLTADVMAIARSVHADQAFDRMPALGDALENAGCHETAILSHCRGQEGHVRECWVLEAMVGQGHMIAPDEA